MASSSVFGQRGSVVPTAARGSGPNDRNWKWVPSGMVNATPDFAEPPAVVNGCSDVLVEVLGERGRHTRSAFGVATLPGGVAVEVEAMVQVSP